MTPTGSFQAEFRDVFTDVKIKHTTSAESRQWLPIRDTTCRAWAPQESSVRRVIPLLVGTVPVSRAVPERTRYLATPPLPIPSDRRLTINSGVVMMKYSFQINFLFAPQNAWQESHTIKVSKKLKMQNKFGKNEHKFN